MTTKLVFGRDAQGYNAYAPQFADDKWQVTLQGGTAQSITIPSNFQNWIVAFNYQGGTNVWVARNTTATLPTNTVAKSASELNPGQRAVQAGDTISFITNNTTADFCVILYAIN